MSDLAAIICREIQIEIDKEITELLASSAITGVTKELPAAPTGDMLAIHRFIGWKEDGRQVYGVRGMGPTYKKFYNEWYNSTRVVWCRDDFPWDYNTFTKLSEADLIDQWGTYIEDIEEDTE